MKRPIVWPILALMIVISIAAAPTVAAEQAPVVTDVWAPLRFFVGSWRGGGEGTPGTGTGEETFEFILRGAYLQVRNKAVFDPQAKNPSGEVHEDWGVFSYDKARKTFVLRSFHVEGFVNQYVLESQTADAKTFVFVSESIENIPAGFRARLTYRIIDNDAFEQTFDLAPPGQEFTCYSKGIMKRQKGEPK
ncbi:MAG: heme-binding beta-barrel domain-containing protein [Candidatus Aminicenantales bacterium]